MKKHIFILILISIIISSTTFAQSSKVLDYLYEISGENILSGQHNREPNAEPARWTDYIYETTGKYPALWSGDFLYQQRNIDNRWTMIYEAKKQWDNGAVVSIMWHACPPDMDEPCGWDPGVLNSPLSDDEWEALLTDGTPLNEKWKIRMDEIAVYLQYLEDNGVEVLWKPFHEMNQGKFWWGGRPGPNGTAKLYRLLHDYFTDVKGLSNLVWVWDMQDMSRDFAAYNPGDEYWDVFAFDIYADGFDASWYNYILPIVGDKPMAIGECGKLPDADFLVNQPRWVFFMAWAELVQERNSLKEIRDLYNNPLVLTLDEMPGWREFGDTPFEIVMTASRVKLLNDGESTAEIKIMLKDEEGRFCGNSTNEINYSVIGNGTFTSTNEVNAVKGRSSILYQSPTEIGVEQIIASSPGLISDTIEIEITNFYDFDDFEDYQNSYELENYWKEKATSQARIYIEKTNVYEGDQSMKFDYNLGNGAPPYSAIYKEVTENFSSIKYIGFWYKPTGKDNQMVIRLTENNGSNWDYTIEIGGNTGEYVEISVSDFVKYNGISDSINLADLAELSINILKGNGEYGESSIFFDSFKFLTSPSIVSIDDDFEESVSEFQLNQNYPNPFNPETTIEFQLKKPADVMLQIYDLRGNLVETLVNEFKSSGYYQIIWNAENYSSGIYIYKLISGGNYDIKKCVLLK